jgi:hypothetical protein
MASKLELTHEEIIALMEYHRVEQYRTADKEEYSEADYHKRRADEWKLFAETKTEVSNA